MLIVAHLLAIKILVIYTTVKHLKKDNVAIPILLDNGAKVSEDVGKTEVLNRKFKSIFTKEPATSDLPNKGPSPYSDKCYFTIVEGGPEGYCIFYLH